MRVSVRPFKYDTTNTPDPWQRYEISWEELVNHFRACASAPPTAIKKDGLVLSFGTWEGGAGKTCVRQLDAIALDYDGVSNQEIESVLTKARLYQGLAHTTFSHLMVADGKGDRGPDYRGRLRIVLPFSEPLDASFFEGVARQVASEIGVVALDGKSLLPTSVWLPPQSNANSTYRCWFDSWQGALLDIPTLVSRIGSHVPIVVDDLLLQIETPSDEDLFKLVKRLGRAESPELQLLSRCLYKMLNGEEFAEPNARNDVLYRIGGEIAQAFPLAHATNTAQRFAAALATTENQTVESFADQIRRQQAIIQAKRRKLDTVPLSDVVEGASTQAAYLIIQKDDSYYVREHNSDDYAEQYGRSDIVLYMYRKYGNQVCDKEGKPWSLTELQHRCAHTALSIEGDYMRTKTTFDGRTLHLATARWRNARPVRHPIVEEWLHLFAGQQHDNLITWLRGLVRLDKECPALFLQGASGVGKNLFAHGVAHCWEKPLVRISEIFGNYDGALRHSPIIYADEGLPARCTDTWIKELITCPGRRIRDPYGTPFWLKGHVRLIVSANHLDLITPTRNEYTNHDASGISERFLVIPASAKARNFLEKHNTNEIYEQIPEHISYLNESMGPLLIDGRWVVKSGSHEVTRKLTYHRFHWFVEQLFRYLEQPQVLERTYVSGDPNRAWFIRTREKRLWVSSRAVELLPERLNITTVDYKRALRFFQREGSEQRKIRISNGAGFHYYEIDVEKLISVADEAVDTEAFIATISADTEDRIGPGFVSFAN